MGRVAALPIRARRHADHHRAVMARASSVLARFDRLDSDPVTQEAADALYEDAYQAVVDLMPLRDQGDPQVPLALFEVGRALLLLATSAGDSLRATFAGQAVSIAIITVKHLIGKPGLYRNPAEVIVTLAQRLDGLPELAAHAALRVGDHVAAVMLLEELTLTNLQLLRNVNSMKIVERENRITGREAKRFTTEVSRLYAHQDPRLRPGTEENRVANERLIQAEIQLAESRQWASSHFATSPRAAAVKAARLTNRTLIYIASGARSGFAIRVDGDRCERFFESIEISGLTRDTVIRSVEQMRAVFEQRRKRPMGKRVFSRLLEDVLVQVASLTWNPLVRAWPDLIGGRVALLPIGHIGSLPLFTVPVGGTPICTQLDLTIAQSAQALHFVAELPANSRHGVLVAADPWYGASMIPRVRDEALRIAALYGVEPVVIPRASPQATGEGRIAGNKDENPRLTHSLHLDERISSAGLAHLACHGSINAVDPGASSLFLGKPTQLGELGVSEPLDAPLIVLSACEIGGFSDLAPGEQLGFPGWFLAMGARSVVGSLWPIPDSTETIELMADFHTRLASQPSTTALADAILDAKTRGVLPTVWGALTHFGDAWARSNG